MGSQALQIRLAPEGGIVEPDDLHRRLVGIPDALRQQPGRSAAALGAFREAAQHPGLTAPGGGQLDTSKLGC